VLVIPAQVAHATPGQAAAATPGQVAELILGQVAELTQDQVALAMRVRAVETLTSGIDPLLTAVSYWL